MIARIVIPVATLAAAPASAHGAAPGIDGVYAGALHPALAAAHLLLLLALGLWLGARPAPRASLPLWGLAAMLIVGLALSGAGLQSALAPVGVLAAAAVVGGAVALAAPPPDLAATLLGAVGGFLVGLDTDGAAASAQGGTRPDLAFLGGAFIGVFLIVLNAMALAAAARRPPFTIAVRVAGSWIAAAAIMVLALEAKGLGGAR